MRQHARELDELNIRVLVVTFEQPAVVQDYIVETGLDWPIVVDRDRQLYQAYSLGRGAAWNVLGPRGWWTYLKLLGAGRKLHKPTDDIYQLGGDVLVDPSGVVRYHHIETSSTDRPTAQQLLSVVRRHLRAKG